MFSLFPELALRKRSLAGNMSGGERQMLAVARALMARPRVIFLDEPLASLSPKPASIILSKLQEIKQSGVAMVIVEQDVTRVLSVSQRAYVLVNGAIAMEGKSQPSSDI